MYQTEPRTTTPSSHSPQLWRGTGVLTLPNVPGRSDRSSSLGKGWERPQRCLPSAPFPLSAGELQRDPLPLRGLRPHHRLGSPAASRHSSGNGSFSQPMERELPAAPGSPPRLYPELRAQGRDAFTPSRAPSRPGRARSHWRRWRWRRAGRIGWRAPSLSPGGAGEGSGRCVRAVGAW